ncbi:MAG TPA: hypothetical protein VGP47_01640 [Parachlamydiaceae bacterium]|nr:hypothetical protein [Parachlamydiaceae bacterium]
MPTFNHMLEDEKLVWEKREVSWYNDTRKEVYLKGPAFGMGTEYVQFLLNGF